MIEYEQEIAETLLLAPYCFLKCVKKCKFQQEKLPMDLSEKNEIKVMHRIIFRASNTVKG